MRDVCISCQDQRYAISTRLGGGVWVSVMDTVVRGWFIRGIAKT